jgi:glycosyltransferase involved in cell wall biosynthesis
MLSLITATHKRSQLLSANALPSVLQQGNQRFEWIIVNDGGDPQTRSLVKQLQTDIAIRYLEIDHATDGFGLCHARNAGLSIASGDLVSYLDDDNAIAPTFVAQVQEFFDRHPAAQYAMVQQHRRRDLVHEGQVIQSGVPFISPTTAHAKDLTEHRQLFDSNGFTHRRHSQLCWNPNFTVFADYVYFLQCLELWGGDAYRLIESVLVTYVQRSDGVIGRSLYGQWATELEQILQQSKDASVFNLEQIEWLQQLAQIWQNQAESRIPAFH